MRTVSDIILTHNVSAFPYESAAEAAAFMESLLLGKNVMLYKEEAIRICPVAYVSKGEPPFIRICQAGYI